MKALLEANGRTESGGSAMLMHNERLADPLDPIVKQLGQFTAKRKKTEADHLEIARLEFGGTLYTNGNGPCVPAWNIIRCLQNAAMRHKRGKDILRGVFPLSDHADLSFVDTSTGKLYDGDRDTDTLWKHGGFSLRKGVGIQGKRTMRTRAFFTDWALELPIEIDPVIFDVDSIKQFWTEAGKYVGLGDMRPVQGRFLGTLKVL